MSDNATQSVNKLRADLFKIQGGTCAHADATAADASPSAVDLPTLLVMLNALATEFATHVGSVCDPVSGSGAHGSNSGHSVGVGPAADLGSARVLMNDLQTALIDHAGTLGAHLSIALLDGYQAMDGGLAEACRFATFVQALFNAHVSSSLNSQVAA